MATLLLRLAGPMQSWGTQSRFRDRDSGLEPSKSGVIGLICAALGRPRDESVTDLVALRMGVRVDHPGALSLDYQTARGNYPKFDKHGEIVGRSKEAIISPRYYLADADFLVGLEGNENVLRSVGAALAAPRWQIFLGRKAFVPSLPVHLPPEPPLGPGMRPGQLEETLRGYPAPKPRRSERDSSRRLRLVFDADPERSNEVRMDVPVSFAERRYTTRHVRTDWMEVEE